MSACIRNGLVGALIVIFLAGSSQAQGQRDKWGFPTATIDALLKSGHVDRAKRVVDQSSTGPGSEDARKIWEIACLAKEGRYESCKKIIPAIRSFKDASTYGLELAGDACLHVEDCEAAVKVSTEGMVRQPNYSLWYYQRAKAHRLMNQMDRSGEDLELGRLNCPDRAHDFCIKEVTLLRAINKYEKAISVIKKTCPGCKNLKDAATLFEKADCEQKLGRQSDAVATLTQVIDYCRSVKGYKGEQAEYLTLRCLEARAKCCEKLGRTAEMQADRALVRAKSKEVYGDLLGK